jgi:poly(3-hydroxybutyrate) depolymerase
MQADRAGILSKSLTHNNLQRDYHLYIPSSYRNSTAAPLVIALHGGGGHTWPGGYQYLPEFLIGKTNRDLDASKAIWDFFNEYRQ